MVRRKLIWHQCKRQEKANQYLMQLNIKETVKVKKNKLNPSNPKGRDSKQNAPFKKRANDVCKE